MSSADLATWLNPWQLKNGFLNPLQTQSTIHQLSKLLKNFKELSVMMEKDITYYLHSFTSEEWINTNIAPKIENIESIVSKALPHIK